MRVLLLGVRVSTRRSGQGAAQLHLAAGVRLLHPQEQVLEAMLDGWRNQQLARNLGFGTIEGWAAPRFPDS